VISIVNYQASNLSSVKKALDYLGYQCEITTDPEVVQRADKVLLPGVGHFAATERLASTGLREAIRDSIARGTPFLGICVGLQWIFEASEEAAQAPGLALFCGTCRRFPTGSKVPHVGWNSLDITAPSRLLAGVAPGAFVYYTHSYRAPLCDGTVATTDYEGPFTAAVERGNVFGVQFHPEKSGDTGLKILDNFGALKC
jgi:imidazole glycerol-phosphate synthase subunit HisH